MTAKPALQFQNPTVLELFDGILHRAIEKKASDVHLKIGLPAIVRVNGNLYYLGMDEAGSIVSKLSKEELEELAYCLMNERQRGRYENGEEIDLGYELQGAGRFRINVCQQRGQPRFVCRYIPEHIKSIAELLLPSAVQELTEHHRGLVLVTGATGSGKSTTLAGMIDHIARNRSCHIITLEDPIEFSFKDRKSIVTQREIGIDSQNFSGALKHALRQDPDVILVGEMRDEETMLMALSAAETGHLVFSTLHTVDATETINRILGSVDAAIQSQIRSQIASTLVGVISQRLLKRADGKGRIAAAEILLSNQRVREMILDPARTKNLLRVIEESNSSGMQTFDQSLMQLVQRGLITKEEALVHCTNFQDFQMRLEGVVASQWNGNVEQNAPSRAQRIKDALDKKGELFNQPIEIEGLKKKKK